MYRRLMIAALAVTLVFAPAMLSLGAVPSLITVQGKLTDPTGDPRQGTFTFTFEIYDAEAGGQNVWPPGPLGEPHSVTTDANGLWTVQIGNLAPLSESQFGLIERWLEIDVDDGVNPVETLSRVKLNTNPFTYSAASSDDADKLDGLDGSAYSPAGHTHLVTSAEIADETIIATDIATGAVGTSEIVDASIVAADIANATIGFLEMDNVGLTADVSELTSTTLFYLVGRGIVRTNGFVGQLIVQATSNSGLEYFVEKYDRTTGTWSYQDGVLANTGNTANIGQGSGNPTTFRILLSDANDGYVANWTGAYFNGSYSGFWMSSH